MAVQAGEHAVAEDRIHCLSTEVVLQRRTDRGDVGHGTPRLLDQHVEEQPLPRLEHDAVEADDPAFEVTVAGHVARRGHPCLTSAATHDVVLVGGDGDRTSRHWHAREIVFALRVVTPGEAVSVHIIPIDHADLVDAAVEGCAVGVGAVGECITIVVSTVGTVGLCLTCDVPEAVRVIAINESVGVAVVDAIVASKVFWACQYRFELIIVCATVLNCRATVVAVATDLSQTVSCVGAVDVAVTIIVDSVVADLVTAERGVEAVGVGAVDAAISVVVDAVRADLARRGARICAEA